MRLQTRAALGPAQVGAANAAILTWNAMFQHSTMCAVICRLMPVAALSLALAPCRAG
jgi:hypothetical protein